MSVAALRSIQHPSSHATSIGEFPGQEPCLMVYSCAVHGQRSISTFGTLSATEKAIGVDGNQIFEPIMKEPEDDNESTVR